MADIFSPEWSENPEQHGIIVYPNELSAMPVPGPNAVNEDVLCAIFDHLQPPDLVSAATVCRSWAVPARRMLYSTVVFSDQFADPELKRTRAQMIKLSRSLTANKENRSFIRRLKVVFGRSGKGWSIVLDESYYSWISLLERNTVHTLIVDDDYRGWHPDFINYINECPALQTVQNLTVTSALFKLPSRKNEVTHPKLSAPNFLSLPALTSLQLGAEYIKISHLSSSSLRDIANFTELQQLSLTLDVYSGKIQPVLHRLSGCLVRLDIHFTGQRWALDSFMLREDLGQLYQLKDLSVTHKPGAWISNLAFMDTLFQGRLEGLKSLYCCDFSFTEGLIDGIPSTVEVLQLERRSSRSQAGGSAMYDALVSRAIERKLGNTHFALRTLIFIGASHPYWLGTPDVNTYKDRDEDIRRCSEVGVELITVVRQQWGKESVYERGRTPISYFPPLRDC